MEITDQERRIIEAAKKLFTENGFAQTSMSDIASEAGITRPALHYYYRTKEKMFGAVFGDIILNIAPAVYGILSSPGPFPEKIAAVVDTYIDIFCKNPNLPYFILNEFRRDRKQLVSVAMDLGLDRYGREIIGVFNSEMEKGNLKKVPMWVVFNTFYGLLLFPFLSGQLASVIFGSGSSAEDLKKSWRDNIISQMTHLLLPE